LCFFHLARKIAAARRIHMSNFSRREVIGAVPAVATGLTTTKPIAEAGHAKGQFAAAADSAIQTALRAGATPGAAVSIWRNGTVEFSATIGTANLETSTPISAAHIFRIGSLTKQFTAAAIVKLSTEGKLNLDDPVARHLRFFSKLSPVTLHELLTHTAGLHSDETAPICLSENRESPSQIALARAIAAQTKPFDFPPGTAWLYSNANFIVLGAIIEEITGSALADAMRALIFAPLGLKDAAFDFSADVVRGRASGYTPGVKTGSFLQAGYVAIEQAGGAGAMRSTAHDLCAWHYRLLNGALFDRAHIEAMMTPGRLRDGQLSGAHRFSPTDTAYGDTQYGLGLLIPPPAKGHRSILHYGAIDGFAGYIETYVELGLTVTVLCNADMNPQLPIRPIRHLVIDQLL
jgi:CubicO group peptidase (beta-lactamase class C family)